jgi:hypothetical protein
MKADAWTEHLPVASLLGSRIGEAGIPGNLYRKPSPISQRDDEFIVSDFKPDCERFRVLPRCSCHFSQ